jgi:integrase
LKKEEKMARKKLAGGFRKLSNGTIEYQVTLKPDIYGNRCRKAFYGKDDDECLEKYREFIKNGEKKTTEPKELILSHWLDNWLETYKKGNVEDSTYEDYCYIVRYVKKHSIGNMKLTDVKQMHVMDFFKSINEYSHSARKKTRFVLNAAFECAIENDLCIKNPAKSVKLAKNTRPEKEPFTEEETRIIVDFAKEDKLFGLAAYIMLNSGIRSGEMRGMVADQIDLENGIITVDRAVKHTEELGLPKNNKTRYIPLEPEVTEFIASQLSGKSGYIVGGSHYVSRAGFRSRYLHFINRLNKYLKSIGKEPIDGKSPHVTRHTYSTIRQKHGMPIAMVAQLLGHCSTAVTDKYTHFNDVSVLSEAVRKYKFLPPKSE